MTLVQLIGLAILAFSAGFIVADLLRLSERPKIPNPRENGIGQESAGSTERALAESTRSGRSRG